MNKLTLLFVGMLALLMLTACETTVITSEQNMNTIAVQGQASVAATPDEAKLYLRIETNSATAQQAEDAGRTKTNAVMEALNKVGIPEEDIETTQYSLQPQWDWTENGRKLRGYQLQHVLLVTTDKITETGSIVDAAVKAGANAVDNIQFVLSDEQEKEVFGEALTRSVQEAKAKAESMAQTLGVRVGKPTHISEQNFNYEPRFYAAEMAMADGAGKSAPTSISPQDVEVQATVMVQFAIN